MSDRLKSDAQLLRALQVLKRRWWVIVLIAVVSAGAAYELAKRQPKQYAATAALLFEQNQLANELFGAGIISQNPDPTRQAATDLALVQLPAVARLTAQALHVPTKLIAKEISFGSNGQADVLPVTGTAHNPAFAANIATTYVQEYITFRRHTEQSLLTDAQARVTADLQAIPPAERNSANAQKLLQYRYELQLLASLQTGDARIVQKAVAPTSPASPKPVADGVIGGVIGLLVALLLVVALERLDRRITTIEEAEEVYGSPIIGTIPESQALRNAGAIGTPREQDAFRMVRAQLRYFDVDRQIRRVLITSADSAEGKSTLALNLARAAAVGEDKRALLIEADMRLPSVSGMVGVEPLAGLSELLSHSQDLASGLRELVIDPRHLDDDGSRSTLDVLVAGATPPNALELLESQRMTELLELADTLYDLVIIDTPPIGVVSDPIALVHQVDGVVVVARLGRSRRDHAVRLMKQLRGLNAHVLGLVVNGVQSTGGAYYYAYHNYGGDKSSNGRPGRRRRGLPAGKGR